MYITTDGKYALLLYWYTGPIVYSNRAGKLKKCHCKRLYQYLTIFIKRSSFFGTKKLTRCSRIVTQTVGVTLTDRECCCITGNSLSNGWRHRRTRAVGRSISSSRRTSRSAPRPSPSASTRRPLVVEGYLRASSYMYRYTCWYISCNILYIYYIFNRDYTSNDIFLIRINSS